MYIVKRSPAMYEKHRSTKDGICWSSKKLETCKTGICYMVVRQGKFNDQKDKTATDSWAISMCIRQALIAHQSSRQPMSWLTVICLPKSKVTSPNSRCTELTFTVFLLMFIILVQPSVAGSCASAQAIQDQDNRVW